MQLIQGSKFFYNYIGIHEVEIKVYILNIS